jgi:hypothetical protein
MLRSVPALAALIEAETKESVGLTTGITIEVISASIAAPRGRAYALVIIEEAAFLPQDQSANPDVELLRAVRPALARVPGSLLVVISSPYARRGVPWQAWQRYHGQPDSDVVFVQAATLALNPTFDKRAVERAYEEDPASAGAEYGDEFRGDVETFIDAETITACVADRRELPMPGTATTPSSTRRDPRIRSPRNCASGDARRQTDRRSMRARASTVLAGIDRRGPRRVAQAVRVCGEAVVRRGVAAGAFHQARLYAGRRAKSTVPLPATRNTIGSSCSTCRVSAHSSARSSGGRAAADATASTTHQARTTTSPTRSAARRCWWTCSCSANWASGRR